MIENENFLRDLIFDQVDVDRFNQECDLIAEQTYKAAKDHVAKVETLAKEMETHTAIMQVYQERAEALKTEVQRVERCKQRNQPKELAMTLQKRAAEVQKEGDKVRKQF